MVLENISNMDSNVKNDTYSDEKIYLDYNATTPLDSQVAESISNSLLKNWQNPSSQSKKGKETKCLINESRKSISDLINSNTSDIIFVSGGTEANNMVFYSCLQHYNNCKQTTQYAQNYTNSRKQIPEIPHIIISNIEHPSVKSIADHYYLNNLAEITEIEVDKDGLFNVSDVIERIQPNTILISMMLANNETGVVLPIINLGNKLKNLQLKSNTDRYCPLFFHTDAAQAIGKMKVDVESLKVDYLTIVGHKFYGPRIGALYARNCLGIDIESHRTPMHHMFFGATQENGHRPGTENTPMIIGLGKAAQLVHNNLPRYITHMKKMRDYLEKRLIEEFNENNLEFNGKSLKSTRLPNTSNVSFISDKRLKGYVILNNTKRLEASTGACCHSSELRASPILLAMKIDESVASNALRISIGRETTKHELDSAIHDLKETTEKILKNNVF